jgi:ABC-type oligopeptide transport system ATPase subunit
VPVTNQESECSRISVLGVSILALSIILLLDFGAVSTVCYLFILHFISIARKRKIEQHESY